MGVKEGNGKARREGVAEAMAMDVDMDVAVEGADAGACLESGAGRLVQDW